jgi:hypothetical protein
MLGGRMITPSDDHRFVLELVSNWQLDLNTMTETEASWS